MFSAEHNHRDTDKVKKLFMTSLSNVLVQMCKTDQVCGSDRATNAEHDSRNHTFYASLKALSVFVLGFKQPAKYTEAL